jgi:hypothetical protein
MRDLAKLRALSANERRLLAAALAATPVVAGGLALLGFRRTRDLLARWPRAVPRALTPEECRSRAELVARIVGIAAGRGPVRATCLRRSLLVGWLLRRDGIETVLRIGVNRDDGRFRAHAWIEHDGRPVGDDPDVARRFTPFTVDLGASPGRLA